MGYTRQNAYTAGQKARGESVQADFDAVQTSWKALIEFTDFSAVNQITADAATRADKLVGFDSSGDAELKQNTDLSGITTPGAPTANGIANWVSASEIGVGTATLSGNVIANAEHKDYAETLKDHGTINTTSTVTVDLEDGNRHKLTFSGSITVTLNFDNWPASGTGGEVQLIFVDAGSVTWAGNFASVNWPNGIEPTWSSSGRDRVVIYTEDAGTTLDGSGLTKFS